MRRKGLVGSAAAEGIAGADWLAMEAVSERRVLVVEEDCFRRKKGRVSEKRTMAELCSQLAS